MKLTTVLIVSCIALTGCGTFNLAASVKSSKPKTQDQITLDTLTCKDEARLAASSTGMQVSAFLLGLTIIGAPAAFEMEKSKQREVFKECMERMGYTVAAVQ